MATYAVGDIQGCYDPLRRLLDQVAFDPARDQLWAVGDLVNRGPDSLGVLRFLKGLGSAFRAVLGNHDLHLLAVACGARPEKASDTLDQVLRAPDREELCDWVRQLPLCHYDQGYLMVHAGVVPSWDLEDTLRAGAELEQTLRSDEADEFFHRMYGDTPERHSDSLDRWERLRLITNVLTRIRFCSADGRLDLKCKLGPESAPPGTRPWYDHPHRRTRDVPLIFGHWAALQGNLDQPNLFALDTGCVWGVRLTALRLGDHQRTDCACG